MPGLIASRPASATMMPTPLLRGSAHDRGPRQRLQDLLSLSLVNPHRFSQAGGLLVRTIADRSRHIVMPFLHGAPVAFECWCTARLLHCVA